MFQYTNTLILNTALDSSGVAKWVGTAPTGTDGADKNGTFTVRRVNDFKQTNVVSVHKTAYSAPVFAKVVIDMTPYASSTADVLYKLQMFVGLSGNQNSYYSNDFVFKGKPFDIEFTAKKGETGAEIAKRFVDTAHKYQTLYDIKWMEISLGTGDAAATVIITALDEYQRFKEVKVLKFDETKGVAQCGAFVPVKDDYVANPQGKEGFGTWMWLTKNMMLPTLENSRFMGVNQEERPVVGGQYNEYILKYKVDRGQVGGAGAVGQPVTSVTNHVFFVLSSLATDFEKAITDAGLVITTES